MNIQTMSLKDLKELLYSQYPEFDEEMIEGYNWDPLKESLIKGYNPEKYGYITLQKIFGKLWIINGYHRIRTLIDMHPLNKNVEILMKPPRNSTPTWA
jgi:hypothetical protein